MSHDQPKQLNIAENMDGLEKLYMKVSPDLKKMDLEKLCKSARKLMELSERYYLERDEENAFIGYMKLMTVTQYIHGNKEFERKKHMVTKILGTKSDFKRILDKLENLKKSLEARYQEQNRRKGKSLALESGAPMVAMPTKIQSIEPVIPTVKQTINASELYSMINDTAASLLIMDCRSETDFMSSQLRYQYLVNVPEHLLIVGITSGKLNNALPAPSRTLWSSRMVKEHVVLMDWNTSGIPSKDTPIYILNYMLCHYDQDIEISKIMRLDGGYQNFRLHYPACCTNPSYNPPMALYTSDENISDIEYPNISDIPMKEDSFSKVGLKPTIDRQSKVAAVSLYELRQKPIEEILVDHEHILDKSKQNALEIINKETVLKNLEDHKPLESESVEAQESLLKEVMQLKEKRHDYEAEKEQIEEQYKQIEQEQQEKGEQISTEQAKQLEQEARKRRLREKEREEQELVERATRLEREREAKLALARQQKRLFKENVPEPVRTKQPYLEDSSENVPYSAGVRLPQFDRSAKPLADHNHNVRGRDLDVEQRDFAPVYGTVVSSKPDVVRFPFMCAFTGRGTVGENVSIGLARL